MNMYEWADEMNCAVTVCDTQGIILYMNEKACRTFAGHGNLIGRNRTSGDGWRKRLYNREKRGQENDLSDRVEA